MNSTKKLITKEKNYIKFINNLIITTWITNITLLIISLILTNFSINFFLTPTIILIYSSTISSTYMLLKKKKATNNLKKLTHKLHIEKTITTLEKTNQNISNKITPQNKYQYNNKNTYNFTQINTRPTKNYKIKKRVLTTNHEKKF